MGVIPSSGGSSDRLPIGQLLVRMLRLFRMELLDRVSATGASDVREPHMQVFGNIDPDGTRLRDLASRANMKPPSMAELVDELEDLGYLERRADPTDRRAKLICLTPSGRRILRRALDEVGGMEADYAGRVGAQRYEEMCLAMHDLVQSLVADLKPGRISEVPAAAIRRSSMDRSERDEGMRRK